MTGKRVLAFFIARPLIAVALAALVVGVPARADSRLGGPSAP